VAGVITFSRRPISAVAPPAGPGWVVTNPPYGVRVSDDRRDLRDLYAAFGQMLRARCPGWQAAFLCPAQGRANLARQTGLPFDPALALTLVNGGLRVRLWQATVPGP
jgi:putative N6-adenine-specific DNA methylase